MGNISKKTKSKAGFVVMLVLGAVLILPTFILTEAAIASFKPFVFYLFFFLCLGSLFCIIFGIINIVKVSKHNRTVQKAISKSAPSNNPAPARQTQVAPLVEQKITPATKINTPTMKEMFPCGMLQPPGLKVFGVIDTAIIYGDEQIPFSEIEWINWATAPTAITNGIAQMKARGKVYQLCYKFADRERAANAISYAKEKVDEAKGVAKNWKYHISAHTGTSLEVYDTYLVINYMRVGGVSTMTANILSGGATGGKRINFSDITAIQFKEPAGMTVGFIQFAYPGSVETQGGVLDALKNENTIPVSPQNLEEAKKIVAFIENKRAESKNVVPTYSSADELKKFKELLDLGVITQDEFDAKKKQLLGI